MTFVFLGLAEQSSASQKQDKYACKEIDISKYNGYENHLLWNFVPTFLPYCWLLFLDISLYESNENKANSIQFSWFSIWDCLIFIISGALNAGRARMASEKRK